MSPLSNFSGGKKMDSFQLYCFISAIFAAIGCYVHFQRKRKKIIRRYWVRPWLRRRMSSSHHNILHLYRELLIDGDVQEFHSTLRMSPDVYQRLLQTLTPALQKRHTNFRDPISPEARLAMTFRYLALGDGFRSLSQQFRIGLSTTRSILKETCLAIIRELGKLYLVTPKTEDEWLKVAGEFEMKWQFPHCIGTIDGKHVRIIAPRKSGSYYYNYKHFFSIVLLAISSADYKFLYVDVGAEGKASDGGIWTRSTFFDLLQDPRNPLNIPCQSALRGTDKEIPYFLVGDEAFRLSKNLMKPFGGNGINKRQQIFNYRLCRCRRTVENTFGILTSKFKIYRKSIELHPDTVQEIVMATCILHNYLHAHSRNDYIPATLIDHEVDDGQVIPGSWRDNAELVSLHKDRQRNATQFAKDIRESLSHYFLTKHGELSCQYEQANL